MVPAHAASVEEGKTLGYVDEWNPDREERGGIRIGVLGRGQSLRLKAFARKLVGKVHAKWNPVCVATFRYEPIITINRQKLETLDDSKVQQIISACPTKVFSGNNRLSVVNASKCMFCKECEKITDKKKEGIVFVEHRPNIFHFTVESTGAIPPEEIVMEAFDVLLRKLDTITHELKKLDPSPGGVAASISDIRLGDSNFDIEDVTF